MKDFLKAAVILFSVAVIGYFGSKSTEEVEDEQKNGKKTTTTTERTKTIYRQYYKPYYFRECTYADAVAAIANSDMDSFDKRITVQHVDTNGTSDYYAGVCAIASSESMSSFDRRIAIYKI